MTIRDLQELRNIAIDIVLNALDNKDFSQLISGYKLYKDTTKQLKTKGATA